MQGFAFAAGGGGVFSNITPATGVSADQTPALATFSLLPNYPNPLNPVTTIRYSLPHRSHVTLTVFNTLGQQIVTLVNDEAEAGFHDVQFNAAGLASGVYFYRLQTPGFVQTRKLLLIH